MSFSDRPTGQSASGRSRTCTAFAGGLQALGLANASRRIAACVSRSENLTSVKRKQIARVGIEPTDGHQGLSLAALPVCVPCCTACVSRSLDVSEHKTQAVAQVGVEPTASLVLSEGGLPIAYRARHLGLRFALASYRARNVNTASFGEKESNLHEQLQRLPAYH